MSDSKRSVVKTKDGSNTMYWPVYSEHYHSIHGALTESEHVFIEAGFLELCKEKKDISVFEMGYGTGLNAMLTFQVAQLRDIVVHYTAVEAFPLTDSEQAQLNLVKGLEIAQDDYLAFHKAVWNKETTITPHFSLHKVHDTLQAFSSTQCYDLIYYDAFAPSAQPELWTVSMFRKLFNMINKGGILTTYCAKGSVKRGFREAGFVVETLPGPPGKREMVRARKE